MARFDAGPFPEIPYDECLFSLSRYAEMIGQYLATQSSDYFFGTFFAKYVRSIRFRLFG
jgi:hypothetical protein